MTAIPRFNLGKYLREHQLSAYALVREVKGQVSASTVYGLARKPAQRIDLVTVYTLLDALERMQGKPVEIQEVIEHQEEIVPEPESNFPHLKLPAGTPAFDPVLPKLFKYSGAAGRVKIEGGPSIVDIISEGRDQ